MVESFVKAAERDISKGKPENLKRELAELDGPLNKSEIKRTDILKTEDINDLDKPLNSGLEIRGKQGGRFGDIFQDGEGGVKEVHHMPSDYSTELPRIDGPAIKMDKTDHRQTASCGNSREAREYRERQKELVGEGKFDKALQMDINDIHEKFGSKYNNAIDEMLDYVEKIKKEGKI